MDQQHSQARGRSPSGASPGAGGQSFQQPHIKNRHSPSPARFPDSNEAASTSIGLGLGIDPASQQAFPGSQDFSTYDTNTSSFLSNQQQPQAFSQPGLADPSSAFDLNQGFTQQLKDDDASYGAQTQGGYPQSLLTPNFGADADFTIFPPTSGESQSYTSLFVGETQLGSVDDTMMTQSTHASTPPHLLQPEPHQPSSANHSPSFNQHQFSSSPGRHSRNTSLGPEAALLPGQVDWSQAPQFQGHRRTPSEFSDVSSVAHSPNLVTSDTFEMEPGHSPMQRPQDGGMYQELQGIGSFTLADPTGTHSPNQHVGRSPSHSPAISPRILPQQIPDMIQPHNAFMMQAPNPAFAQHSPYMQQEAFPQLVAQGGLDAQGMPAPPSINIDFAPPAGRSGFEQLKSVDIDSLTPPDRGKRRLFHRPCSFAPWLTSSSPRST